MLEYFDEWCNGHRAAPSDERHEVGGVLVLGAARPGYWPHRAGRWLFGSGMFELPGVWEMGLRRVLVLTGRGGAGGVGRW